jgi:tRNA threonylcarbamoyladenosine biosynthesis protein TsaE
VVYHTKSSEETVALGRALASQLQPGDVVAFYGDLGAGKTTMIKGVAAGLDVADVVKSPSFVIITEYQGRIRANHQDTKTQRAPDSESDRQGRQEHQGSDKESRDQDAKAPGGTVLPVYHIDLYRLNENCDFESIGLDSYLEGDGVCLIEWAERAEKVLPEKAIRVRMSVEVSGRRIEVDGLDVAPSLLSTGIQ